MARTKDEIIQSILTNMDTLNPSVDVTQGPLFDGSIEPLSSEFPVAEQRAEDLVNFYSADAVKTTEQADIFATNFTIPGGSGSPSKGFVYFIMFTAPTSDITIPQGTIVSTEDRQLAYATTLETTIVSSNAAILYNATQNWYEIKVAVEAIANGPEYNLVPYRIRLLLDPITGIDLVQNRTKIEGGVSSEDATQKFARVQNRFAGLDSGTQNGVATDVKDYSPDVIKAVSIVRGSERSLFKRVSDRLALDIYILGSELLEVTDEQHDITSTVNQVILSHQPVTSITEVKLNGTVVTNYTLVKDVGILSDSTASSDKIVFSANLINGDVVNVTYTYNSILEQVRDNVFAPNEDDLWDVDTLIRSMIPVLINISAKIQTAPSKKIDTAINEVSAELQTLIENDIPGAVYQPEIFRQQLRSTISGLTNVSFLKFTTTTTSNADVETIELKKNQYGVLDLNLLSIK